MGVLSKLYQRINWKNYPSEDTPLNETNLNRIDAALDEIDNRVISLNSTTLSKVEAYSLIKSVDLDKATGVITITYLSGEQKTIDTLLEKMAVNFDFDSDSQKLVITLDDGTQKEVDLSAFITETEFEDTDTIAFSNVNHKASAEVKDGSITEEKLQPNYLADIKTQAAIANKGAEESENNSNIAKSYAVGGTGTRAGEDTDNAKYYAEQAKAASGITIDEDFDKESLNPVQNKVVSVWKEKVEERLREASGDISESSVNSIEELSERIEISPGDKMKLIIGKIVKTFSDIKKIAFSGSAKDLEDVDILNIPTLTNNLLATETGTALDATQGAAMKGEIDSLKSGLAKAQEDISMLNSDITLDLSNNKNTAILEVNNKHCLLTFNGHLVDAKAGSFYSLFNLIPKEYLPQRRYVYSSIFALFNNKYYMVYAALDNLGNWTGYGVSTSSDGYIYLTGQSSWNGTIEWVC